MEELQYSESIMLNSKSFWGGFSRESLLAHDKAATRHAGLKTLGEFEVSNKY
jgi:hypothetical protein